ncbi:MAG TPA: hypothetical protein VGS80_04780, partial [Ktedonobacterales bacterium]|nr:hypothetical protein [Ktedonobacterales bacterium]
MPPTISARPRRCGRTGQTCATRIAEYETAIRANRQLASVLQPQGLSDQAGQLTYRAQLLRRQLLRWQLVWGVGESEASDAPRLGCRG